jgi:hypothetical protein
LSPRRAATALGSALVALALAACATLTSVRPRFGPLPGSILVRVDADPAAVIRAAEAAARDAGLRVAASVPEEGYLETAWHDLADSTALRLPRQERRVRLRMFADPSSGRTLLIAECAVRLYEDPSLPERELEHMVPETHPGYRLLQEILRDAQRRLTR